jgi:hypothetical protein
VRWKTLTAILLSTTLPGWQATAEEEPEAQHSPIDWNATDGSPRSRALELAGAFSNDTYKMRDGFWSGELVAGTPVLVEVYLFAGNDYWFSAANLDWSTRLRVRIFNENGNPAGSGTYEDRSRGAAGISVVRSGRYYVEIALTEGDKAETCMVYSYR